MFVIGTGTGFWAVIVTNAAEQFGTNIRGTVATTVPNFIRGSLPIITLGYTLLQLGFSKLVSAEILAVIIMSISLWALHHTAETYGKDLDFVEE
jgi:putative MFS transporter